ncbi:MAG: 2'-5' RNA ligase family protein [Bacilli bacterium]
MKYFIGIAPPADIQRQIDVLRRRYPGRHADHIEPHITLVPPVGWERADAWLHALRTALERHAPFALSLGACAWFGQRTLYLSVLYHDGNRGAPVVPRGPAGAPRPDGPAVDLAGALGEDGPAVDPLRALRQDLLAVTRSWRAHGLVSQGEERPFHPHLTLAMSSFGTTRSDMRRLAWEADRLSRALPSFAVRSVRVYARHETRWERHDDLALDGADD